MPLACFYHAVVSGICAVCPFTVLIGSRVYENINGAAMLIIQGNTALSYIANKVRQGDRAGG